jgi:hypothetical protein
MKTKVLIDSDTLLEFLINRGHFEGNVKDLSELVDRCRKNEIDLYISSYGLDSIKIYIDHWKNSEASGKIIEDLKKKFKIKVLKVFKYIMEAVRNCPVKDISSAIEVILAQRKNIGAIVTYKPENFYGSDVNILSFSEFQKSQQLELLLQDNIQEPSVVLRTSNLEQVSVLNRIYQRPSYSATTSKHGDSMFRKKLSMASRGLSAHSLAVPSIGEIIAKSLESTRYFSEPLKASRGLSAHGLAVSSIGEIIAKSLEPTKYFSESLKASRGLSAHGLAVPSIGESIAKSLESTKYFSESLKALRGLSAHSLAVPSIGKSIAKSLESTRCFSESLKASRGLSAHGLAVSSIGEIIAKSLEPTKSLGVSSIALRGGSLKIRQRFSNNSEKSFQI